MSSTERASNRLSSEGTRIRRASTANKPKEPPAGEAPDPPAAPLGEGAGAGALGCPLRAESVAGRGLAGSSRMDTTEEPSAAKAVAFVASGSNPSASMLEGDGPAGLGAATAPGGGASITTIELGGAGAGSAPPPLGGGWVGAGSTGAGTDGAGTGGVAGGVAGGDSETGGSAGGGSATGGSPTGGSAGGATTGGSTGGPSDTGGSAGGATTGGSTGGPSDTGGAVSGGGVGVTSPVAGGTASPPDSPVGELTADPLGDPSAVASGSDVPPAAWATPTNSARTSAAATAKTRVPVRAALTETGADFRGAADTLGRPLSDAPPDDLPNILSPVGPVGPTGYSFRADPARP
jgi:hypothetical protein